MSHTRHAIAIGKGIINEGDNAFDLTQIGIIDTDIFIGQIIDIKSAIAIKDFYFAIASADKLTDQCHLTALGLKTRHLNHIFSRIIFSRYPANTLAIGAGFPVQVQRHICQRIIRYAVIIGKGVIGFIDGNGLIRNTRLYQSVNINCVGNNINFVTK